MLKRLIALTLATAGFCSLSAEWLSPEEALARVSNETAAGSMRAPSTNGMKLTRTMMTSESAAAVYIFQNQGQMMIVAADDVAAPLLGFIDGNIQGEMPPQMEWWLDQYVRQIDYLQAQPERVMPIEELNRRASRAEKAPIPQMLTTVWNQDAPFNNLCPSIGGQRTYTGCVATAAAQVMKYFNYPEAGTGTISYSDEGTTRTLALDGKKFDWDNMIDSYNRSYNSTQANAVAYLMQACGYAASMNYGTSASGTQSSLMLSGAQKYLGYNQQARSVRRDFYSLEQWEDLVYANLATVGPLYYSGDDGQAGHAFVCDGYQGNGYFHFNWGWGGAYDGYFKLDALNPAGQGIGGNEGGFNYNQQGFFNFTRPGAELIQLPQEAPFTQTGNLSATIANSGTMLSFTSDVASQMGVYAYNTTSETYILDFGMKAVNINGGTPTFRQSAQRVQVAPNNGYITQNLYVPSNLPDGTYNFYPVTKINGTEDWMEYNHTYGAIYYVTGTVANGRVTSLVNNKPGSVEVENLSLTTPLAANSSFKITYSASNPGITAASVSLMPCVAIMSGGNLALIGRGESLTVSLEPGATKQIEQTSTLEMVQQYQDYTGEVYLCLINQEYDIYDYIVTDMTANYFTLAVTKFDFVGNPLQAVADDLRFDCGIRCTAGNFSNPITVFIGLKGSGRVTQLFSSDETFFLSSNQTASAIVRGQLPDATIGTQYTAYLGYITSDGITALEAQDFTIASMSGVESVAAETAPELSVAFVGDDLSVTASSAISAVSIYTVDGRCVGSNIAVNGNQATASSLPRGLLLVTVQFENGAVSTTKLTH